MTDDDRAKAIGGGQRPIFEDDSQRSWACGCYEDQGGYHFCSTLGHGDTPLNQLCLECRARATRKWSHVFGWDDLCETHYRQREAFCVQGPAVISFSGGRTSGYMLRRILDQGLGPDVHVLFADTGKERAETYAFVREIEARWHVPINWVERPGQFTQLIADKQMLPNPVMRFCTSELKMKPIERWMRAKGYDRWTNVVGIRADEPRRVTRLREREDRYSDIALPLADAGVTLADVTAFWQAQPFDLQLKPGEGNCDLCFLKGFRLRQNIARDHPELAVWWIEQEEEHGARFRNDGPRYVDLFWQRDLFDDEGLTECYCTD